MVSRAGAGTVRRTLGTLNLVVSLAADDFQAGKLNTGGLFYWLTRHAADNEQLDALNSLTVVGPTGTVQLSGIVGGVGANFSDRDYFRTHLQDPASKMVIGLPILSRIIPHQRIVPLSWALRSPSGKLASVITVAASVRLYAKLFAELLTTPVQTLALIDQEGIVYALDARSWPDTTKEPPRPRFVDEWVGSGADRPRTLVTDQYVLAGMAVPGLGLQIVTAEPIGGVLANWYQRVFLVTGGVAIVSLSAGLVSWRRQRNVHKLQLAFHLAEAAAADARAAQERAEASERSKVQFLAAMSHEIRTPMTGVLGMADLLAAEQLEPRQHSYVRTIRTSGQHLLSVINDILDFSRFGAGGITLEEVDFSMADMLEQVLSIMAPQAAERGLYLRIDLDKHAPSVVQSDPTRLRQILVNLIGNGLKFTSDGGVHVAVQWRRADSKTHWFRFAVEDTGIGISEDQQQKLFQAFMQADRSTARKFGGSGLGLAICRQLVTAMGGNIGVESSPGQGSTFSFELLLKVGDPLRQPDAVAADISVVTPLKILVAEDVEVNRDLLNAFLAQKGHLVAFAENGEQAVSQLVGHHFDVVLMDVQMPVMDGIEATRRIRTLHSLAAKTPIVGLTANVMDAERQRCLAAGMDRVLTKPVIWDLLFKTLAEIASQGGAPEAGSPMASTNEHATLSASAEELLDHARIDGLRAMAGAEKLSYFLKNAITSAEQLCTEVERLQHDLPGVAAPAHRLAGTAPSFGLLRVGAVAQAIEQRASEGQAVHDLVRLLKQAVAATRIELGQELLARPDQ